MVEGLSAVNAILLVLSGGWLFFIGRYHYMTLGEENSNRSLFVYKWSVTFAAIGIFVLSVIYFLYDFDLIYQSQRRDLGMLPRLLFAAHLMTAYTALNQKLGSKIIPSAVVFGALVYIIEIIR